MNASEKSMQSARSKADNTESVLDAVCGKWIDKRDADTMVRDIYASRVNKDDSELLKILSE